MKTRIKIRFILMFMLMISINNRNFASNIHVSRPSGTITVQYFYDYLSPFGRWVEIPDEGYCWIPDVPAGFVPYNTNGHWVFTDEGTAWVSYYDWGWAPFHYGRWFYDDFYGWVWLPDTEWAPAWVCWRHGGGYFGWYPLAPGWSININFAFINKIPDNRWMFCRENDLFHPRINKVILHSSDNIKIIHQTTVINHITTVHNVTYASGPERQEIRDTKFKEVPVYKIQKMEKPGRHVIVNNNIKMYRPEIMKPRENEPAPMPQRIFKREEFHPAMSPVRSNEIRRTTK
ncbi:MAG: hypothetical protein BWX95_00635 [Bacteroidetes bacterium ADurb.Bin141]|nr:MAG: hypothetical protein UZ10_BCD003000102 [Bacteroidetes bacterium OLB10]MCB0850190.1 hypothetical protein [Bacteroidota bacterium]MCB8930327.1 hypothetical protein [Bacteroidia bacterium]MCW5932582.1 hypothetical protein [Bacteroidota bacterium]OQB64262.1 MAG: hypothetical protein BWX95_00635 [Bacteroidetes bacterium ADurb.Bin141]